MKRIPRSFLIAFGIAMVAGSSALGQATINSSHRSVTAWSFVEVGGPEESDESETEDSMVSEDAHGFFYEANASATVFGVERQSSSASLLSNVSTDQIFGIADTHVSGYDLDANALYGYHVWVEAIVEMRVEFTITAPTSFSLDITYDSFEPGFGGFNALVFDLASESSSILSLNNNEAYDIPGSEYDGELELSGVLEPGDYTLFAHARPVMYLFHGGQGYFKDSSFSFFLSMDAIPAPSPLAILAAPTALLAGRRRR